MVVRPLRGLEIHRVIYHRFIYQTSIKMPAYQTLTKRHKIINS